MSVDSIGQSGAVVYKDIPDFPGYRVGDDGTVWSCRKRRPLGFGLGSVAYLSNEWKRLNTRNLRAGYPSVTLCKDGVPSSKTVHWLVMLAFRGPCPDGMQVAHEDGTRTNCCLSNLTYKTHSSNQLDRRRHGTDYRGEKCPWAKLTEDDVRAIRIASAAGRVNKAALARTFGVSRKAICMVLSGRSWPHVKSLGAA